MYARIKFLNVTETCGAHCNIIAQDRSLRYFLIIQNMNNIELYDLRGIFL